MAKKRSEKKKDKLQNDKMINLKFQILSVLKIKYGKPTQKNNNMKNGENWKKHTWDIKKT